MSAYIIANVRFHDPEHAAAYGRAVAPVIAAHGGRYLVRGGRSEVEEGTWSPAYLTIVEFASLAEAHGWYASPEYAAIKPLRLDNADSEITFVEGL
jgi:uncharacterized protein (DUF1330 family)